MENIKELINIDTKQNYQGYLWWSDQSKPEVYNNQSIPDWKETTNPFIIEGQLFDEANKKSYSIRFADGKYVIKYFDLNELEGLEYIKKEYLPNRFEGIQNLCFKEYWRPVEDDLCEGIEVLKSAETVFIGFNY